MHLNAASFLYILFFFLIFFCIIFPMLYKIIFKGIYNEINNSIIDNLYCLSIVALTFVVLLFLLFIKGL